MSDKSEVEQLNDANKELHEAQIKIRDLEKALEGSTPEAVYAFSTKLTNAAMKVRDAMFTVRARPGEDGKAFMFRVDAMLKFLSEHGWSDGVEQASATPAQGAPAAPPAKAPPAERDTTTYEAHAVLMEIGESYKGNKPQLVFHCDGLADPLKMTSRDTGVSSLIKALNRVGNYLPDGLTKGRKYNVDYVIHWCWSEDSKYRNIIDIFPNK